MPTYLVPSLQLYYACSAAFHDFQIVTKTHWEWGARNGCTAWFPHARTISAFRMTSLHTKMKENIRCRDPMCFSCISEIRDFPHLAVTWSEGLGLPSSIYLALYLIKEAKEDLKYCRQPCIHFEIVVLGISSWIWKAWWLIPSISGFQPVPLVRHDLNITILR